MEEENNFIEDIYLSMQVLIMIVLLNSGFPLFGKSGAFTMKVMSLSYVIFICFRFYNVFRRFNEESYIEDEHIIISGLVEGMFLVVFVLIKLKSNLTLTNVVFAYVITQIIRSPYRGKYIFMSIGILLEILMYTQSEHLQADLVGMLCDIGFIMFITFSLSLVFKEIFQLQEEKTYAFDKLKESNDQLSLLASTDYLTGLHNYQSFYQRINDFSLCHRKEENILCMAILDIDDFKHVNDTYGHPVGDAILSGVAAIINKNVRNSDFVARYGGEEFAILFPNTQLEEAQASCERLRQSIEEKMFSVDGYRIRVTISIGVSKLSPLSQDIIPDFIKKVDMLLYDAKANGKNQVISKAFQN